MSSEGTNFWLWPYWDSDGLWKTNVAPADVPGLVFPAPNTAAFKVQRSGGVDLPLTVNYSISGTASNGVDYESLSGVVTIPAGERTAKIMINPMDDLLPEPLETVVVALLAPLTLSTAPLPGYVVGFPRSAAAVIVDNDQPRPPCLNLPDGIMHICRPATNGFCYRLEASRNLVEWIAICTNRVTDGAMHFVDPETKDTRHRFYRMLPEANPPQE